VLGAGAAMAAGPAQAAGTQGARVISESPSETVIALGNSGQRGAAETAIPLTVCGPSNAWVAMLGEHSDVYICAVTTVSTAGLGPYTDITSTVSNRIWLHQNANNSGWANCFRGPAEWLLSGENQNPGNIQVSSNTAAC
jgi:hypothetical protein